MLVKFNSTDILVLDGLPNTAYWKDKICQCKAPSRFIATDFKYQGITLTRCADCNKYSRYYFGKCEQCRGVFCTLFYHPREPLAGSWCWWCCEEGINSPFATHRRVFPNKEKIPLPDYLCPPRENYVDFDTIFDSIIKGVEDIL